MTKAPTVLSDVMSVQEAAKLLGLGINTIYEAAARNAIPHRRIGRRILFSREAILVWLKGNPVLPK